jgi:hypothetical protein
VQRLPLFSDSLLRMGQLCSGKWRDHAMRRGDALDTGLHSDLQVTLTQGDPGHRELITLAGTGSQQRYPQHC